VLGDAQGNGNKFGAGQTYNNETEVAAGVRYKFWRPGRRAAAGRARPCFSNSRTRGVLATPSCAPLSGVRSNAVTGSAWPPLPVRVTRSVACAARASAREGCHPGESAAQGWRQPRGRVTAPSWPLSTVRGFARHDAGAKGDSPIPRRPAW